MVYPQGRWTAAHRTEGGDVITPDFSYNLDSDVVARYFLALDDGREEPDVTHLKLQKLLYLAQANFLASTGHRLMNSAVEAFDHGPVVYDVYRTYTQCGKDIIVANHRPDFDANEIPADARQFVAEVWNHYKDWTASALRQLTHEQDPWLDHHVEGSYRKVIPDESMVEYFRSKEPRSKRVYHPNVVMVDYSVLDELDDVEDELVADAVRALRG
jgi:uncharacterized phage-associated protein